MLMNSLVSRTILLEGAHRVGKGTALGLLCSKTDYAHTVMDRGFASAWAFGQVFGRQPIDLRLAIRHYFANPSAVVVYYALGADDLELDRAADAARKEQWVGIQAKYSNVMLDNYIAQAINLAQTTGYSDRILILTAREHQPEAQCKQILDFLSQSQTPV